MKIEVSNGEIADKMTILQIKMEKMSDPTKRENVKKELQSIIDVVEGFEMPAPLVEQLKLVNEELWDIEDKIRECEKYKDFGDDFVKLARMVYYTNDKRSDIKKRINQLTGSELTEEKSYKKYGEEKNVLCE